MYINAHKCTCQIFLFLRLNIPSEVFELQRYFFHLKSVHGPEGLTISGLVDEFGEASGKSRLPTDILNCKLLEEVKLVERNLYLYFPGFISI